jgi:hypothetical protein
MVRAGFHQVRPAPCISGLLLLAVATVGCNGGDYGTVTAAPKSAPEVVEVVTAQKGAPVPKVPRGPGQAKALQDAKQK